MGLFQRKKKPQPAIAMADAAPSRKASSDYKKELQMTVADERRLISTEMIPDRSRHLKMFFSLVTRYVPAATSAVWTWKNLCFSSSAIIYSGGTAEEQRRAQLELDALSKRIFPLKFSKGDGFERLLNAWAQNVFRYGRFSGRLKVSPLADRVETFEFLDAFRVYFTEKDFRAYYADDAYNGVEQNPATFYYYGLDSDTENPYGASMVEAASSLMETINEMFRDMKLSSSNAGTPRLHIRITQPEIFDMETIPDYTARCNTYFNATVDSLRELAADDNLYTWKDVEVTMVGGPGNVQSVWKQNLQSVQEELISAFHLFPWIMGKQFGTTRNWVAAQFDVLMQMVHSVQMEASSFVDWVCNTHLALCGLSKVKVRRTLLAPRDIAAREMALAEKARLENTEKKIQLGFIDKGAGAREHGYEAK